MALAKNDRRTHLNARLREEERVTPLELFFDLVFVLAITQCTALMAHDPGWSAIAQGLLDTHGSRASSTPKRAPFAW
jgi:low temperature requirement protein LtrA